MSSDQDWVSAKKLFDNRCAQCLIAEESLSTIRHGFEFQKLARAINPPSHLIPVCPACLKPMLQFKKKQAPSKEPARIVSIEEYAAKFKGNPELGTVVCTSLPGDPIHPGHLSCLQESARYGNTLVVIVNGDWFLSAKKGDFFMPLEARTQIIAALRWVDIVVPYDVVGDMTVSNALRQIYPHIFTKGGDRKDRDSIPEWSVCEELGIYVLTGIGDEKVYSSSELLDRWCRNRAQAASS